MERHVQCDKLTFKPRQIIGVSGSSTNAYLTEYTQYIGIFNLVKSTAVNLQ